MVPFYAAERVAIGQHGSMGEALEGQTREFLAGVDEHARRLLGAPGTEYDVGLELMGYSLPYMDAVESAVGVYMIWGALTDGIDGPAAGGPEAKESVIADMRRAASEWLTASRTGAALRIYLDHWVHDECGYAR